MYQASNATTIANTRTNFMQQTNELQQQQHRNDDQFNHNATEAFRQQSCQIGGNLGNLGSTDTFKPDPQRGRGNSVSLALGEIGVVSSGKDFIDLDENKKINHQYYVTQQQQQESSNNDNISTNYQNNHYIINNTNNQIKSEEENNDLNKYYDPFYGIVIDSDDETMQNYHNNNNMMNTNFHNNDQRVDAGNGGRNAYVEIVEQPSKCALRFRYKCEGRSAGSLPGVNSTNENKTYPSIKIHNYVGRAVVVISCVTKEAPYRSHPHNVVGKEGCKKGICTIVINNELDTVRSFASLGIQCVKRKDIEESLNLRESIKVDPFRNGFDHKMSGANIDLNVVRLCFQVFITGSAQNKCDVPLTPVVSDPIHDKKAMSDLVITKLSHCSAPATGGREVILLCDRISKDDIQICFYEEREGKIVWETVTELSPTDIHKQVAICFKTPKYHNENITQPVMARIQLKRLSDNQVSEPRLFQFLPCESDEDIISRKRQKIQLFNMNHYALDNILQPSNQHHHHDLHHQHHQNDLQQQQRLGHLTGNESTQQLNNIPPTHYHPHQHHQANLNPNTQNQLLQPQPQQQPQQNAQACTATTTTIASNLADTRPQGSPRKTPLQARRSSPVGPQQQHQQPNGADEMQPAAGSRPATTSPHQQSPSPTQLQQQQNFMIESKNLVVRREIIDNEGRVMRLVDRPAAAANTNNASSQEQTTTRNNNNDENNTTNNRPLDSSLDRIHISELMPDMTFNQNIDLGGLGLSLHLNSGTDQ